MFSSKRFNLVVISVALILGIGSAILYYSFIYRAPSVAAWFDDTWHYRAPITVTNGVAGDLTDFQVAVTVDTATLITAGKMQSTCADLRFTNLAGKSLPYWIEPGPGCNSATSRVWVKVDTLPKDGSTIYIYYGNPSALDHEDGGSVFEFFDDFSGASIDPGKWTTGTIAAANGTDWSVSGGALHGGNNNRYIQTRRSFTGNYAVESRVFETTPAVNGFMVAGFYASASNSIGLISHNSSFYYRNDSSWVIQSYSGLGQWSKYRASAAGTAGMISADGETSGSISAGFTNSGISGEYVRLGARYDDVSENQTFVAQWDYVFVRKAATTAPTIGSVGTEEKGTGPVAWWKFDEGYGVTAGDSSGKNNTGALTGGVTWKNEDSCKTGKCLSFDGSTGYINDHSNNFSFLKTTPFSGAAWIKTSNSGTQMIITNWNYPNTSGWLFSMGGTIALLLVNPIGTNYEGQAGSTIVSDNRWHLVSFTYDGSNTPAGVKLYVDGKAEILTETSLGTKDPGTLVNNSFEVGRRNVAGSSYYFNGSIDDVRIYDRALSLAEIKQLYTSASAGKSSANVGAGVSAGARIQDNADGLVGWWKMDEASWNGTPNEVKDSSGAGNNGTSSGANTSSTAQYGRSGEFNGSSNYVEAGDSASLKLTSDYTFSAWIYPRSYGSHVNGLGRILNKRSDIGTDGYEMEINKDYAGAGTNNLILVANGVVYSSVSNIVSLNSWQFVTISTTGGTAHFYVNGNSAGSVTVPTLATNSSALDIGRYRFGNALFFDGLIDDVKIYNRYRTPEQIRRDFETGPPPMMRLKMDEGSGTQINDDMGSGNSGAFSGGVSWVNGKYGKALSFDGSTGYVTLKNAFNFLSGNDTHTVSFWINVKNYSNSPLVFEANPDGTNNGNDAFFFELAPSSLYWGYRDVSHPLSYRTYNIAMGGGWHHISLVKTGATTGNLYLDGILKSSYTGNFMAIQTVSNKDIILGKYISNVSYLDGSVDDVRIYNYARTQKQIIEDMNAGHSVVGSPVGSAAAYWKFDEGNNAYAYDSSPSANSCSFVGGASSTPQGKFGSAVKFASAGDYLDCGSNSSLNITGNQITISTWINPTAPSNNQGVIFKGSLTSSQGEYSLVMYLNQVYFRLNGATVEGAGQLTSKQRLAANTWYHVVATYDGVKQYLYINGILDNQAAYSSNISDSSGDSLKIGIYFNTPYQFSGKIDETKIYPYALSPAEIKKEYDKGAVMVLGVPTASYATSGKDPGGSPPIGWWKMDDGSGTLALDASGNGNNGTLSGAVLPVWKSAAYCKKGGCLSFDGSAGYLDNIGGLSTYSFVQNTGIFTVSSWIKLSDYNLQQYQGIISNNLTNSEKGFGFRWTNGANERQLELWISNGGGSIIDSNSPVGLITDNNWHYVAATGDGTSVIFYIDGRAYAGTGVMGAKTSGNSSRVLNISRTPYSSDTGHFNGLLDDVKIFNYTRTPAQIAYDYNKGAPVGWWKFDEGQGYQAKDASGNGNNGTLVGFPTDNSGWVAGKWNKAVSFDGTTDYVDAGNASNLSITGDLTLSAWVYPHDTTCGGTSFCTIVSKWDTGEYWLGIPASSGKFQVYRYQASLSYATGPSANVALNTWQHVVLVSSGTAMKLYINGVLKDSSTWSGTARATSDHVFIGNDAGTPTRLFNGKIDDVRIYNYALSADQVKQVYNNGAAVYFK